MRQETLFAQRFDPGRLALAGEPMAVAERVTRDGLAGPAVSASTSGTVAYRTGTPGGQRQLVWFDRSGKALGAIGAPEGAALSNPDLSPDGTHVAVDRRVDGNVDVWLLETTRDVATRFTFDPAADNVPVWAPDGRRLVFRSNRKGSIDLYQKLASGAGTEELLLESPLNKSPEDWSPDGRFLLVRIADPKTGRDLWALPLQGARTPFPVVQTEFEERDSQFAPDGRWIAYASNMNGRFEVYVQPFPGPGGKWQVSTAGGGQPRWRRDGRELFYVGPDGTLLAAPIALAADGHTVEVGKPVALFMPKIVGGGGGVGVGGGKHQYAVARDGQRFLINVTTDEGSSAPITVILNWTPRQ